jgi:mRNA interferase RelE/StbE
VAYGLRIRPSALKELHRLGDRDRVRVVGRIEALAEDPRPPGSEKLAGPARAFRVRAGDYRVIYTVDDVARLVIVEKVGHRGDVYRRR